VEEIRAWKARSGERRIRNDLAIDGKKTKEQIDWVKKKRQKDRLGVLYWELGDLPGAKCRELDEHRIGSQEKQPLQSDSASTKVKKKHINQGRPKIHKADATSGRRASERISSGFRHGI